MKLSNAPRRTHRAIALALVGLVLVEVGPMPVYASPEAGAPRETPAGATEASTAIKQDMESLSKTGKEAYLDSLFKRVDTDVGTLKDRMRAAAKRAGESRVVVLFQRIKTAVVGAGTDADIDTPKLTVLQKMERLVDRSVAAMKTRLSGMPKEALASGLESAQKLMESHQESEAKGSAVPLARWYDEYGKKLHGADAPRSKSSGIRIDSRGIPAAGNTATTSLTFGWNLDAPETARPEGRGWFEQAFTNTLLIRNLSVVVVGLTSLGVAVYISLTTVSAAALTGVLGSLTAFVAFLTPWGSSGRVTVSKD